MGAEDYERVEAETRAEWRRWLAANHATSPGVWLVSWRHPTGRSALAYEDAVEEALCFGWIDSVQKPVDDERSRQLFTPRRAASRWSRSNKERVERLEAAGLLERAGLAAIAAAKESGAWTALDDVERLFVPDDLAAALAACGATEVWEAYPPSVRRAALVRLLDAKREETRAKRLAELAAAAAAGRRPAL